MISLQGLGHAFGFNMHEAQRAFTKCAAADPTAPMCSWGLANAHGPFLKYALMLVHGVLCACGRTKNAVTPRARWQLRAHHRR